MRPTIRDRLTQHLISTRIANSVPSLNHRGSVLQVDSAGPGGSVLLCPGGIWLYL